MSQEARMEEIRRLLTDVEREDVRTRVSKALGCLSDPNLLPIVTNAINRARRAGYSQIALNLALLAYELYPKNSFFLVELCTVLITDGRPQDAIDTINEFLARVPLDSLSEKDRDTIVVTLASAYKGVGNIPEGIRMLEELHSDRPNVIEQLAEQYYKDDKPEKAIELLTPRERLTKTMAFWLAKSYDSLYRWEEAKKTLEPFKNDPAIREYYQEITASTIRHLERVEAMTSTGKPDPKQVFVVHGRNETVRSSMFAFLRAIGLKPIEWTQALKLTEEPSPYIGKVLDSLFSAARAVVVVLTGDDEAKLRNEYIRQDDPEDERALTPQARPNVLFEAGMAFGRCPERTLLVALGKLRPFSDIAGRHLIKLDNSTQKRQELAMKLEIAGCPVDLSGTDWHTVGNFEADIVEEQAAHVFEEMRQHRWEKLSLERIANDPGPLEKRYPGLPLGERQLNGVPFVLSTKYFSLHRMPAHVDIPVELRLDESLERVGSVHVLIIGGNVYKQHQGTPLERVTIGRIQLIFHDKTSQEPKKLIVGENIREWVPGNRPGELVDSVTEQLCQVAWRGKDSSGKEIFIDHLEIPVQEQYRGKALERILIFRDVRPGTPEGILSFSIFAITLECQ